MARCAVVVGSSVIVRTEKSGDLLGTVVDGRYPHMYLSLMVETFRFPLSIPWGDVVGVRNG